VPQERSSHLRTSVGTRRLLLLSCLMAFSHGLDTHLGLALRLIHHDLRLRALRDIIASLLSACMTVERKGNEVAVGFGGKRVVSSISNPVQGGYGAGGARQYDRLA
jgi:hypothetical protein